MNLPIVVAVASLALSTTVGAAPVHIVDGVFGPLEWTVSSTNGSAAPPNVSRSSFTVGGIPNAAYLYAAQYNNNGVPASGSLGTILGLMYDCTICGAPLPANAALDIFFTSRPDDYVVHVFSSNGLPDFRAFEKPVGTTSTLNPDGSLNLADPVWTALTANDLAFAKFAVAVGFGRSPNFIPDHYFAEFELSVNTALTGFPPNGLYSPEPAFWSASTSGTGFPTGPISSANFTLNPDGTTTVVPILGPNGDPIIQLVPEPGILVLVLTGVGALGLVTRRGKIGELRPDLSIGDRVQLS